jgi:hypothetical protein
MGERPNLTDPALYLGSVVAVSPVGLTVNLPFAAAGSMRRVQGRRRVGGLVGDFVCIEADGWALVGRLDEVRLPERDRAMVDPMRRSGTTQDPHPLGRVTLLATIHVATGTVDAGAERPAKLGASVFLAPTQVVELTAGALGASGARALDVGSQPLAQDVPFSVSARTLFDRHCAVVGSTGGGKSWTTARLVEQVAEAGGKILLIDPTGEYRPPESTATSIRLGVRDSSVRSGVTEVRFPYWEMTNEDLFALFTPAGQTQAPLLREAMTSLRLVAALRDDLLAAVDAFGVSPSPDSVDVAASDDAEATEVEILGLKLTTEGVLVKEGRKKRPFVVLIREYRAQIEQPRGSFFEARVLVRQLRNECVWPSGYNDSSVWGNSDDKQVGYVVPLVLRIESLLADARFGCVFDPPLSAPGLAETLTSFLAADSKQVLHLDVSTLPIERHFRQIVVNAIARLLLEKARSGAFKEAPLIVAIDEAHHFLGRVGQIEEFGVSLDGLELIAKEGRKYGLHLLLATQRPRDMTRPVLSQIGCLFVHRLTESEDMEVLSHTAGRRDAASAAYVPGLSPGQALVFGASLPFPVVVQVHPPTSKPESGGSDFDAAWGSNERRDVGPPPSVGG